MHAFARVTVCVCVCVCGGGGGGRHKARGAPLSGEGGASAPNAPPMGTPLTALPLHIHICT